MPLGLTVAASTRAGRIATAFPLVGDSAGVLSGVIQGGGRELKLLSGAGDLRLLSGPVE